MSDLPHMIHGFRLYRSGWSDDDVPWVDNQLWAAGHRMLTPSASNCLTLDPQYGHSASWYQIYLDPAESPETGWICWRARLVIDSLSMGGAVALPLSWYVGAASDWPSGLARWPETHGPNPTRTFPNDGPRGVWTLAAWRTK